MRDVYFPYPTLEESLILAADGQAVDGKAPPVDLLTVRRSIDLSGLPPGWRRATISFRLDLPLLKASHGLIDDIEVVVCVNCRATNLRTGQVMRPGARIGSYVADLEIEYGAFAKRATLKAVISGTIDGVPNRYFGESEEWNIWVSAPEIPILTGDLQVQWAEFENDEKCPQVIEKAFRKHAYYVDVTADPPIIYLNDNMPDLRRLFDETPRRTATERALRDAHFATIASSGWLAMFNASLGGIEEDGDAVTWPENEWQKQVLLTLLPRVYPDLAPDDAMRRAYEDDNSADGARLLQSRAMAAISSHLQEATKIRRTLRALEDIL